MINKGKLLKQMGNRTDAIGAFNEVVKLRSKCEPHKTAGKKKKERRPLYCQDLQHPANKDDLVDALYTAYFQIGLLYKHIADSDTDKASEAFKAEMYFKQAAKVQETAEVLVQLGEYYHEVGGLKLAASYYKRCITLTKADAIESEAKMAKLGLAKSAKSDSFVTAACHSRLGTVLEDLEDVIQAADQYRRALELAPDHKFAQHRLDRLSTK
jgi:tetratricopeptide (TPR) repeat protein